MARPLASSVSFSRYEVFISFRGATRNTITSYLHDALKGKQIHCFLDETGLEKGESLWPTLEAAIETCKIALVVLSKEYPTSKWCLKELGKIMGLHEMKKLKVLPVFYQVDPTDVRHQSGEFGKSFAELEKELKYKAAQDVKPIDKVDEELKRWKDASKEIGSLSGWPVDGKRKESDIVKDIVRDVLKKLDRLSPINPANLVGLDSRIETIKSLLSEEPSSKIQAVGIWGMPGSGKTAIAGAVFDSICMEFEGFYFLPSIREGAERHGMDNLQIRLLAGLLEDENLSISNPNLHPALKRLGRKKVLIALDDVDDSIPWQNLLGGPSFSLHPSSVLLITTRNKKVLEQLDDVKNDVKIYPVQELSKGEALELFSLYAFKKNRPPDAFMERSVKVMTYTQHNPLALCTFGSDLCHSSETEWDSRLENLKCGPRIEKVFRITFEGLSDEEKDLLLDFACFFRGEDIDYVTKILKSCYPSVSFSISVLIEKSLLTVSDNKKIEIHNLVQEMAQSIVFEESKTEPERRSRLWNQTDVLSALNGKKGTKAMQGVFLNLHETNGKQLRLLHDVFKEMHNLRLLKFYVPDNCPDSHDMVRVDGGPVCHLPDKLCYLHWHGFPSTFLPRDFSAENLVELRLPYSKNILWLWRKQAKVGKLRTVDLRYAELLWDLSGLATAYKLERVILKGCRKLTVLPRQFQNFHELELLDLSHCEALVWIPPVLDSKNLRILNLSYCYKIKRCPEIHVGANLEELDLSWTEITQVPASVRRLKFLRVLRLVGCGNITRFPDVPESIEELYLGRTSVAEIPSSVEHLTRLVTLDLGELLPTDPPSSLSSKFKGLLSLTGKKETVQPKIPNSLGGITSLKRLILKGNNIIETLPESITQLSQLEFVDLSKCKRLRSLPQLPPSLEALDASECELLETLITTRSREFNNLNLANCLNLNRKACTEITGLAESIIHQMSSKSCENRIPAQFLFPGNEAPSLFREQSPESSISFALPSDSTEFNGIAFFMVIGPGSSSIEENTSGKIVGFKCAYRDKEDNAVICASERSFNDLDVVKADHVLMWYDPFRKQSVGDSVQEGDHRFKKYYGKLATFDFELQIDQVSTIIVKSCGIVVL